MSQNVFNTKLKNPGLRNELKNLISFCGLEKALKVLWILVEATEVIDIYISSYIQMIYIILVTYIPSDICI